MEIHYLNHEEFKINTDFFKPYIDTFDSLIDLKSGIINVIFVNNVYIQALNKSYRNKDRPTDVLSFNYEDEEGDSISNLFGEVYISYETASRQAIDHGHDIQCELIKLITHGILHVHGHDHEKDEDYKQMFAIEKAVLGEIAGELLL